MHALSLPPHPGIALSSERRYTLARNVPAIQILSGEALGSSNLGLMSQLPAGADILESGPGFNDRTLKVRSSGISYYIFLEDLEPQRKPAASVAFAG